MEQAPAELALVGYLARDPNYYLLALLEILKPSCIPSPSALEGLPILLRLEVIIECWY